MSRNHKKQSRERREGESGFSLLELMIAAVLTVGLIGGIFAIANRNQQVFVTESGVTDMNQNARTLIDLLTRDIQSAGVGLPAGVANGNFAAIFYKSGPNGASDSIMMINGDPFAPVADLDDRAAGSAEFFLIPPPDVAVIGNGSNAKFTYTYTDAKGNSVQKPIYRDYSAEPRIYLVYDETNAMLFTLTKDGQMTGNGGGQRLKIQHNPTGYLNPPSLFGTPIGAGEPNYDNSHVAMLANTVAYRLDTNTRELMRTEDLQNWYTVARGVIDFQIEYRVLHRLSPTAVEEKVTGTPGDGLDRMPSGQLSERKNIRAVIITIEAETPDVPPTSPSYRRVTHKFEVAPRNLNLVNNNNLTE
ncbi:MAG TPA: hypothetical protein VF131_25565 [Blastocatellia bacterium]|nr:hypothetical protein [Blastocatellia bacterium]